MSLRITLGSSDDGEGFLHELGRCLHEGAAWDAVTWVVDGDATPTRRRTPQATLALPAGFVALVHDVVMHRADDRFMRLHRMAQRVARDGHHWDDVLHPEHVHLRRMQQQVRREVHKTKAFVRFTRCGAAGDVPTNDGASGDTLTGSAGDPRARYVAWFEPEHHIVRRVAPFFARRFTAMRWALLTPLGSVEWDGRRLVYGPRAERADAPPPDAGEGLWLTYYERIFNPARVKVNMMKREMPVRFWRNLPEAARIPALIAQAPARAQAMQDHAAGSSSSAARAGQRRASAAQHAGEGLAATGASQEVRLRALHQRVRRCTDCDHACGATQAVTGEGPAASRLMIVGEQPGDREDLEGRPFVGPAGHLLRAALREAGLDERAIYFTNAVKHFAFTWRGKRRMHKTPGAREVEQCRHWLDQEIALVRPTLIVAAGRTAAHALDRLPSAQDVQRIDIEHPAALLRTGATPGSARHCAWVEAWRAVAARIPGDDRLQPDPAWAGTARPMPPG